MNSLSPHDSQPRAPLGRRDFLRLSALAGLAGTGAMRAAPASERAGAGAGAFRFAFLTDIHVQPEKGAGSGFSQCIGAMNALSPKVDFVITGGDHVMDSLEAPRDRIHTLWTLFDECWKPVELTAYHVIGNHDVGGWAEGSPLSAADIEYGKKTFADRLGRGRTWRSFDHHGWHFILLDSIKHDPGTPRGFLGWIDDEQIDWLKADLQHVGKTTPIIVVSHIPFFSVVQQVVGDPRTGTNKQALVNNAHVVRKLFVGHNLRLVLSGHGHVYERIEIQGITYIQGGAVCGNWWKGPIFGYPEGYGVVSCQPDGTIFFDYRGYGWKAQA